MYVCHTNQIITLEDEKVNSIENSVLKNDWIFEELYWKWEVFYKVGLWGEGV